MVASKYIVSAAHCFFIRNSLEPLPEDYCVVRLGDHNLNETGETEIPEKTIKIKKVFTHEEYEIFKRENSTYTLYNKNDIALLELTEEVDLNVYTPACMAKSTDGTYEGANAQVYGWGSTKYKGKATDVLLEVNVTVVTNDVCSEAYTSKYPKT